jgi:antitoxin component of MazEF toxin-antitoxin module
MHRVSNYLGKPLMTTATLRNWGGSVALPIPPALLGLMGFTSGQKVQFSVQNDGLLVKPVKVAKQQFTLAQLMAEHEALALGVDRDWIEAPDLVSERIL